MIKWKPVPGELPGPVAGVCVLLLLGCFVAAHFLTGCHEPTTLSSMPVEEIEMRKALSGPPTLVLDSSLAFLVRQVAMQRGFSLTEAQAAKLSIKALERFQSSADETLSQAVIRTVVPALPK